MERQVMLTYADYSKMKSRGGLVVVAGPMCGGKSTLLADVIHYAANADSIHNRFLLVCPEIDSRTDRVLYLRNDSRSYAIKKMKSPAEIMNLINAEDDPQYSLLVVDEAHFFDSVQLSDMVRDLQEIHPRLLVVLGMLDRRADGKFWPAFRDLVTQFRLNVMDGNLIMLTASCDVDRRTCVIPATHTYFEGVLPPDGISPGADRYHPMC